MGPNYISYTCVIPPVHFVHKELRAFEEPWISE